MKIAIVMAAIFVFQVYLQSPLMAGTKKVLGESDFKYLGAFLMPGSAAGGDAMFSLGLTHRYVDGKLRLLSVAWNPQNLYEVEALEPSTENALERAEVVMAWGDVTLPARENTTDGGTGDGYIFGLYWDSQASRLYWSYGSAYNTEGADDPSVGCSTLNDTDGTSSAVGVWKFTDRGPKATNQGVISIPQWFADQYTQGKRLAAGFGGYQSIIAVGPVHLGPALAAFDPPSIDENPTLSSLPYVSLIGYPYTGTCEHRAERDDNYTDDYESCNPVDGVGHWSWSDQLNQACVWIDMDQKHGVVFIPLLAMGRQWYETSALHAENCSHWIYVYDPDDLADVAQGIKEQWEIQAADKWEIQFPGLDYPLPGWDSAPKFSVTGATFDSTTNRLYISVREGENIEKYSCHKIYVYEIVDNTTPGAPINLRISKE